jgi:hypothetical protein
VSELLKKTIPVFVIEENIHTMIPSLSTVM